MEIFLQPRLVDNLFPVVISGAQLLLLFCRFSFLQLKFQRSFPIMVIHVPNENYIPGYFRFFYSPRRFFAKLVCFGRLGSCVRNNSAPSIRMPRQCWCEGRLFDDTLSSPGRLSLLASWPWGMRNKWLLGLGKIKQIESDQRFQTSCKRGILNRLI